MAAEFLECLLARVAPRLNIEGGRALRTPAAAHATGLFGLIVTGVVRNVEKAYTSREASMSAGAVVPG